MPGLRRPVMQHLPNVALIAGVTGTVGSALAAQLARGGHWSVCGISRRPPRRPLEGVTYLQADLGEPRSRDRLPQAGLPVTDLFYCARAVHAEQPVESVEDNLAMLRGALEIAERDAESLRHVHLVQGGKYYGVHVGPFRTPAREDQQRCVIANFNYDQQDLLVRRSADAGWNWSASRPNTLLHFSPGNGRNLVSTLGAYAALCRSRGAAMDFPGPPRAYGSLTQVTTLDLLARTMEAIALRPGCANEAFNVTNTDVFRWSSLWPRIAEAMGVASGVVRPMRLADVLADGQEAWTRVRARHGLQEAPLADVANWAFADATLERTWDEVLCHNKGRRFGLDEWDDTEPRFLKILQSYREAGILP